MNKSYLASALLLSTVFGATEGWSACPVMDRGTMAFYLSPGCGAFNQIPSHDAIVYTRKADWNPLSVISNACAAIGKITSSIAKNDKEYEANESDVVPGKLVCKYNINGKDFKIYTMIKTPISKSNLKCPSISERDSNNIKSGSPLRTGTVLEQVVWKTEDKNVLSFFKAGSSQTYEGKIDNSSTPFKHTCTYPFKGGEKNLILNGVMDFNAIK